MMSHREYSQLHASVPPRSRSRRCRACSETQAGLEHRLPDQVDFQHGQSWPDLYRDDGSVDVTDPCNEVTKSTQPTRNQK